MTPDEAMFAGFMNGVELVQGFREHLRSMRRNVKEVPESEMTRRVFKGIEDAVALEVAGRMEDAGMEKEGL